MASIIDTIEDVFDSLGLMEGDLTEMMLKRGAVGFILGGFIITWWKPAFAYRENGEARPWRLTSQEDDAVLFPWWSYGAIIAIVFSLFV